MKFTEDQTRVLENTAKEVLVSASAGSGKTATIIEKMVKIICEEKVCVENILSITFTEAASSEMKIRLKEALRPVAAADSFVRQQFEKLGSADISTLHSFCSKMIRKNFFLVDLKPNFAVLNENNAKYLRTAALEKMIDFYSKKDDEDFVRLSSIFESGRNFEGLKNTVLSVYDFLLAVENKEEFVEKYALKLYESDLEKNEGCKFLNEYIVKNFHFLKAQLREVLLHAKQQKCEYFKTFIESVLMKLEVVNEKNSFFDNQKLVENIEFQKVNSRNLGENESEFWREFQPFLQSLRDKVSDIKKNVCLGEREDIQKNLEIAKGTLKKILEVTENFEKFYTAQKTLKNALDFNDLERYFLRLLQLEEIRKSIDFKYIFVDEYQDINPVQEKIISLLSAQSRVVMVGDIKQSIYAFRNSTPEIFVQKSVDFEKQNEEGSLVVLNENFRSNPAILEFVNDIFKSNMTRDFGGVDYKKSGIFKGKTTYEKCSDIPFVEVMVVDETRQDDDEKEAKLPKVYSVLSDENDYGAELTSGKKEAMVVAKKIEEIYGKNLFDAKTKEVRKIAFSDIAILCRNNEHLKEVAKGLLEFKIPIATNLVENVFTHIDVQVLLSFLKINNNFHDDLSLSTFMTSFFGGFSFDDLAKIRRACEGKKFFYNCVKKCENLNNFEEEIKNKITNLFSLLKQTREKFAYKSIYEILTKLCDEKGYFDFLLSLPDGTNRSKIVKDFVQSFSGADYNYDLVGFVDFVENYALNNKFKTAFTFGEDSVKMNTIHASKGLEFPVVFLVGCGKNFSNQIFVESVLKDKNFGFGLASFDEESFEKNRNVARNVITLTKRRQEREEELRLLYVALTRAKNHLFVVGNFPLKKARFESEPEGANKYFSWIFSCFPKRNFEQMVREKKDFSLKKSGYELVVKVFKEGDIKTEMPNKTLFDFSEFQMKEVEKLKKYFSYTLPKKKNIALKNSVSSLLREHAEEQENVNLLPKELSVFERENSFLKGSELGTFYHQILEKIDFEKPFTKQNYEDILTQLKQEQKQLVDISFEKINLCVNTIQKLGKIKVRKEVPFISYIPYSDIFEGDEHTKILVQGVADLLVKTEDKNYLVDYKITKSQNPDQLVEKYKVQLRLYKICLEKALNIVFDGVYVYSFHFDRMIKVF